MIPLMTTNQSHYYKQFLFLDNTDHVDNQDYVYNVAI